MAKVRDSLSNPKALVKFNAVKDGAESEFGPKGDATTKALKNMKKGFRYTENHIIMEQLVREKSKCAASNVSDTINAVTMNVADESFEVQCSSASTVLLGFFHHPTFM